MKKPVLGLLCIAALTSAAFAGTETYSGKEMKQVAPPPCPQWYADNEFNVGLWGTYVFTGNEWQNDRYLETDHAWGGGVDVKYFFCRYFGVGAEGYLLDAKRNTLYIEAATPLVMTANRGEERRVIGSAKGTLTLRYPIHCSRLSPYVWVGAGAIFGGEERDSFTNLLSSTTKAITVGFPATHSDSVTRAFGQVGTGLEIRLTPHIGWMSDFSWNVVNGPNNNFGMARSGVTFAF